MAIQMIWYGGPRDGEILLVSDQWNHQPIRILSGSKSRIEERYVTPRLTQDGVWILPYYEGRKTKETR